MLGKIRMFNTSYASTIPYDSDPKFSFEDTNGRIYREGLDFNNGLVGGRTERGLDGNLYFCFEPIKVTS